MRVLLCEYTFVCKDSVSAQPILLVSGLWLSLDICIAKVTALVSSACGFLNSALHMEVV